GPSVATIFARLMHSTLPAPRRRARPARRGALLFGCQRVDAPTSHCSIKKILTLETCVTGADRCGQPRRSGQVPVDLRGRGPPLGDAPYDQRLSPAGVAGDEDAVGPAPVGAVAGERPTGIEFEAEPLGLGPGEAERQEDEIGFEDVLGARGRDTPAVEELRLGDLDPAHGSVPVADEARGRGQVASDAALLMRTLDLEDPRQRRPGIVLAAL